MVMDLRLVAVLFVSNFVVSHAHSGANGTESQASMMNEVDMLENCPSEVDARNAATFSDFAGLKRLPPYYFLAVSTITKPVLSTLVFGPPKPMPADESVSWKNNLVKQGAKLAFLGLAVAQTLKDVTHVYDVFATDVDVWSKTLASAVILGSSTNIPAACNAFALWTLTDFSVKWSQCHGLQDGVTPEQALGWAGAFYVWSLMATYGVLTCFLMIFVFPAIVAYIWVSGLIAIGFGLAFLLNSQIIMPFIFKYRHVQSFELVNRATDEEEAKAHLVAMRDDCHSEGEFLHIYNSNMDSYMQSGVPECAWASYWVHTLWIYPWVVFFTPIAARLYTGTGYMLSLKHTLLERHLSVYISCSVGNTAAKLKFLWLVL